MKTLVFRHAGYLSEDVNWGFEYMLTDAAGQGIHRAVQCKDFLGDVVWAEHMKKPVDIYGFKYTPGGLDITTPPFYVAITHPAALKDRASNLLAFLHAFEEALGFKRSKIEIINENTGLWITFSGGWLRTPVLFSAFTQFLRSGIDYAGGSIPKYLRDAPMQKKLPASFEPRIEQLLNGNSPKQSWTAEASLVTFHHKTGLTGYQGSWEEKA